MKKLFQTLSLILLCSISSFGQQTVTEDEAIRIALKNNLMIKSGEYQIAYEKQIKPAAFDLGKTSVNWMHGQFNSVLKDNNYSISQTIPFPTSISSKVKLANAHIDGAEVKLTLTQNELVKEVRSVYNLLLYLNALSKELTVQDSLFSKAANATQVRYRVGDGTLLEKTTAETQLMEVKNQLLQVESDIAIQKRQLQTLLNAKESIAASNVLQKLQSQSAYAIDQNPQLQLLKQEVNITNRQKKLERSYLLPDISIGYFSQSLIGFQEINNTSVFFDKDKRFTGFQLGLSFPLWFVPQQSRAKAFGLNQEAATKKYEFAQLQLEGNLQQAQLELAKNANSLKYYEEQANTNADLILRQARKSFEAGEVSYLEFLQAANQARNIKFNYLEKLNLYNQAVIQLDYLSGNFNN